MFFFRWFENGGPSLYICSCAKFRWPRLNPVLLPDFKSFELLEGCSLICQINGKCSKTPRNSFSGAVLCARCVPESHGSITGLFRAIAGRLG
jgi:hypothetical protein